MTQFHGNWDLVRNELQNARIQNLASAPAVNVDEHHGLVYFDTTLDTYRGWNGSEWLDLANLGESDHGSLTGLADDDHPHYALADGTRGDFEPTGSADAAVAAHEALADPHSQYLTQVEGDGRYVNETDLTKAAIDALNVDADTLDGQDSTAFAAAGHDHDADYDASGTAAAAVSAHEAAGDPHSQYLTQTEGDGRYLQSIDAETVADIVGGMVTGNTETGLTVTYQDADNTLDFVIQYGTAVGLSPASTNTAGSGNTGARANHTHAITGFATESHNHDADYTTQADIDAAINSLVDSAPGTLDTLNEIAAALGDDPNFATTITNQLNEKPDKYATAIGDGAATDIVVTHNLNTRDVKVEVYNATTYETVGCGVIRNTVNQVTLTFGAYVPTAGEFRVVVMG